MASFSPGASAEYINAWLGNAPVSLGWQVPNGQAGKQTAPQPAPYGSPTVLGFPQAGGDKPAQYSPGKQDYSVYRVGQASPQQNPYEYSAPIGQVPGFQFRGTDFTGATFSDPSSMSAQMGAMAQALNDQRGRLLSQQQYGGLDPTAAYQSARDMIQGGWQNPFSSPALPALQRQSVPPAYPPAQTASLLLPPQSQRPAPTGIDMRNDIATSIIPRQATPSSSPGTIRTGGYQEREAASRARAAEERARYPGSVAGDRSTQRPSNINPRTPDHVFVARERAHRKKLAQEKRSVDARRSQAKLRMARNAQETLAATRRRQKKERERASR